MKKQFFLIISCALFMQSQLVFCSEEKTIDLVICNDSLEVFRSTIVNRFMLDNAKAAIIIDLINALFENQLVLSTQSLWLTFQSSAQIWNKFIEKSEKELIEEYENLASEDEKAAFDYKNAINFEKKWIERLDKKYKELMEEINKIQNPLEKNEKAQILIKKIKKELRGKEELYGPDVNQKELQNIFELFLGYIYYNIVIGLNYSCKQVTYNAKEGADYLLFIPNGTISGYDWDNFVDYDHTKFLSEDEIDKCFDRADHYEETNSLGKELLKTLKILTSKKQVQLKLNPFFNIYLTGHGNENRVAEISINIKDDQKNSDFLQILNFFQYFMNVKSLAISSCLPGGQKINSAFVVSNQWNNINLEKISYPIIVVGSFFATTSTVFDIPYLFDEDKADDFASHVYLNYFKYLHEKPANYESAARVISGVDFNNKIDAELLQNFAMIRYPNTSWFTPVDLKIDAKDGTKNLQFAQKISQIQALTNPIIKISSQAKVVKLEANVIDSIKCEVNNLNLAPDFLPLMQNNQNYVINRVEFPNIELDNKDAELIDQAIGLFLPLSKIEEPVNIVIKELKFRNVAVKNIYAFAQKTFDVDDFNALNPANIETGYIFTDQYHKTKILTWLQNDEGDENEEFVFDPNDYEAFDINKLQALIKQIETKAKKDLKDFSALEKMFETKKNENKNSKNVLNPEFNLINIKNNMKESAVDKKIKHLIDVLSTINQSISNVAENEKNMKNIVREARADFNEETMSKLEKNIRKEESQKLMPKIKRLVETLRMINEVALQQG